MTFCLILTLYPIPFMHMHLVLSLLTFSPTSGVFLILLNFLLKNVSPMRSMSFAYVSSSLGQFGTFRC